MTETRKVRFVREASTLVDAHGVRCQYGDLCELTPEALEALGEDNWIDAGAPWPPSAGAEVTDGEE